MIEEALHDEPSLARTAKGMLGRLRGAMGRAAERGRVIGPGWMVFGALVVGALIRLFIAFSDDGIYWPDEVHQSLEPAHRLVFGYGLIAWEFIQGARNWALPGLVAGLFAFADRIGLHTPAQYLGFTRCFFVVVSLATAWGVWALARALGASRWPAAVAAAAYALCRVSLYFSHRAMSENACALPVVLGLFLLVENRSRRCRVCGASLLGVAVLLRLQCGIFCVAALVWQLGRRRVRDAAETFTVFAGWALLYGWLDHLTWSHAPGARFEGWFHSALKYLEFNLVEGRAAAWGVAPWPYYLRTLGTAMPILWPMTAAAALLAARKKAFVFAAAIAFLAAHSFVPHKELRFILPILPLAFALAAVGLSSLPAGKPRTAGLAAFALAAVFSLARYKALTFGDLGSYNYPPLASAWDDNGPINRLLKRASAQPDLCGLRVDAALAWTGGFSYLHRKVPIYMPGYYAHYYNYAIAPAGSGAPVVAVSGTFELVHTSEACAADLGYSWILP